MKKALSIMALAALIVTSGMGVAHARQTGRNYYDPQQGGYHCPWMGQSGNTGRGGWYCGWRGNGQGRGWHMGPRSGGYTGPRGR